MQPKHLSPSATSLLATDMQGSILRAHTKQEPLSLSYATYGFDPHAISDSPQLRFNAELRTVAGFYLLGSYRAYNPILMRFHSPDRLSPFGAGNINAYAYCSNDPVNYTDASGYMKNPLRSPAGLTLIGDKSNINGKLYRNEQINGQTKLVPAPKFTDSETIHLQNLSQEQTQEIQKTSQNIQNYKKKYGRGIKKMLEAEAAIDDLNTQRKKYVELLKRTQDLGTITDEISAIDDKTKKNRIIFTELSAQYSAPKKNLILLTHHLKQLEADLDYAQNLMRTNTK
ncbi:RHS repeat-associated core domain-containing protein [Pseudomonas soli]|uniref:RHS repeat-associated core domain-containing protein n=1 Tax=Pseudomonas soli TaxID=1306993 RepID=UPI001E3B1599|nr:RHS repeat-associated core domain-containing protein [Pseudomonas soli]WJO22302.1 RHS repeat-associated core domain-containing protein [Pseudomonas soli]